MPGIPEWERRQRALAREMERERKAMERAQVAAERERKRLYIQQREREVVWKNRRLEEHLTLLGGILARGLTRSARIDLRSLIKRVEIREPDLGPLAQPLTRPVWERFAPKPPSGLSHLLGGSNRYTRRFAAAKQAFEQRVQEYEQEEAYRQRRVTRLWREHMEQTARAQREMTEHNRAIEELQQSLARGDKAAVENYLRRVLAGVPLPADFPCKGEVVFNPRTHQAVLQFELPPRDVVPKTASYRYLPTKDEERSAARSTKELGTTYRDLVSQVALLCIRDLFDSYAPLTSLGFNGHVHAINPATGVREYPCVISISAGRESFPKDENLARVTPDRCVGSLNAIVSNHPYDLEPIEPILDFDLSKYSFVEGFDAVSTLDARPDLMQMSPTNFEHLVRQIFEAQGAEGWTTEQSNDDGVDAVIAKRTALMGGLSIVQAKRYSKAVGISHVRELAGAMEEKKAGWGILITTSWFTPKCWEKAREHSRMELIDGPRLKHLVKEHLGKDVLISVDRPRSRGS